jgi:ribonucleoside-diphosphate reductase alpha chain
MHLLAIAPNANSSILCGCSASIEPRISNCYVHRTRAGSHTVRNPYLEEVLDEYMDRTPRRYGKASLRMKALYSTWSSYPTVRGLHLKLRLNWIRHGLWNTGKRQEFICQGQSVNVFFPAARTKLLSIKCISRLGRKDLKDYITCAPLRALQRRRLELK